MENPEAIWSDKKEDEVLEMKRIDFVGTSFDVRLY